MERHCRHITKHGGPFVLKDSVEAPEAELSVTRVVQKWYEDFRDREQD